MACRSWSAPAIIWTSEIRKVTFVKRVVAYGLPILVGSGYYLDE